MTALEKSLRWVVLGGIFVTPLIVFLITQSLFFPFITGKNFAFRLVVEVITGAWLALALVNPAYRPRRSWLLAAFALFLIVVAAADAFGVNPFKSFWSNFERMDGWVTLVHLFAYFAVTSAMLSTEKLWRIFFQVTLSVSVLVGLHALLQLFGVASLNPGFSSAARLDATFGNPIYLAVYMLFHIFIGALLLSQLWQEKVRFTALALLYIAAIALNTLILFLTGTRGTILGLVGGVMLAALLFTFTHGGSARKIAIGALVGILVLAGGIYFLRDQAWVRQAPVLGRLATISITEQTAQSRIMNWGTAWKGVQERPVLGWGQENFAVVFNKYYNPKMYNQEQWFDRVHNVIFDWLVAAGFLGLIGYLSLFALAVGYLWRKKRSPDSAGTCAFTSGEQVLLIGLLAAYLFHNLFVFDNIMSYILFTAILAFIAFRYTTHFNTRPIFANVALSPRALPLLAVAAVLLVWGTAWYVNAKPIAANKALLQALIPHAEGPSKNLEYFEKSISYGTIGTQEAREQLVQATAQLASLEQVPVSIKQKFVETAAREMTLQAQQSPLDPRFPLFLGSMLDTYGLYAEARPILERAQELAPTKQTILFEVAANALGRGDTVGALSLYKKAFELEPSFMNARLYYAIGLIRAGQMTLAEELLAPLAEEPLDVQMRFTLASAYYAVGNSQKSIELLEAAILADPGVKERAEELIRQIRAGTLPR